MGAPPYIGSANSTPSTEASEAGILWDLYDQSNDDYTAWGGSPGIGMQDGTRDSMSVTLQDILKVCKGKPISSQHPQTLAEFRKFWFSPTSLGHEKGLRDVWYEHGIQSCCMGQKRGNVDYDPADNVDIADLTLLVDHLYINFTPLQCMEEADLDGQLPPSVDLGDLTVLVDHLMVSFQPLPDCG